MKKLYSKNTAVKIITLMIILFACKKNIQSYPGDGSGSVQGVITDLNNSPISNAAVTGGTATAITDAIGKFTLKNVQFNAGTVLVTVTKDGFFKVSKNFASGSNVVSNAKIQLVPKSVSGSFIATAGGNVTIAGGSSVNFGAGFIIASSGIAYSGNVSVSTHYLDPADPNFGTNAPGELKSVSTSNPQGTLQSFGIVGVEMNDAAGNKLQLASGKTASITFPISSSLQSKAPATVPLWYFDDTGGIWKQEGVATKQGSNYIGVVSHFTFWNAGDLASSINLTVSFIDSIGGLPFVNKLVTITRPDLTSKNDYTNSSGTVSGLVPVNEILKMSVTDSCGMIVYSQNIGPFSTDTSFGSIYINDSNCKPSRDTTTQYINLTLNGISYSWTPLQYELSGWRTDTGSVSYTSIKADSTGGSFPTMYILCTIRHDNAPAGNVPTGNYPFGLYTVLNSTSYNTYEPNGSSETNVTQYESVGGYITGSATGWIKNFPTPITDSFPFTCTYRVKRIQ